MLVCSDVRDAHMGSSGTRAQYEVQKGGQIQNGTLNRICICLNQDFQDYQIFRISHIKGVRRGSGAVRNADRIWVSTP